MPNNWLFTLAWVAFTTTSLLLLTPAQDSHTSKEPLPPRRVYTSAHQPLPLWLSRVTSTSQASEATMVNIVSAVVKACRGFDLDDAFAYDTAKIVRIRDRKLGFLYYLFWSGILVYIILSLFYSNKYIETETPVGSAAMWSEETPEFLQASTSDPYCNNPAYDFQYDPDWIAEDVPCVQRSMRYILRPTTSTERQLVTTEFYTPNDVSSYSPQNFTFLVGVGELRMVIDHTFAAHNNDEKNMACQVMDSNDKVAFVSPDGLAIRLKIKEILQLAGLGLDELQTVGSWNDPDAQAYVRLTGAVVKVEFTYENYDEAFDVNEDDITCSLRFKALRGQWGVLSQIVGEDTIKTQMGIQLVISTIGKIGRFSFVATMTTLVSAIVLLKLAVKIVDFIALNVLDRRYLYRAAKYSWTADYEDEDGRDEMDVRAEDHIAVTRRDLRAAVDNLLLRLSDAGVKLPLKDSRQRNLEKTVSHLTKRSCCGGCKKTTKKTTGKPALVKRPNTRLILWDDIVAGSGTSEWGLLDAKQRGLCSRTFHTVQESLGVERGREKWEGSGNLEENAAKDSEQKPQAAVSSATGDVNGALRV